MRKMKERKKCMAALKQFIKTVDFLSRLKRPQRSLMGSQYKKRK